MRDPLADFDAQCRQRLDETDGEPLRLRWSAVPIGLLRLRGLPAAIERTDGGRIEIDAIRYQCGRGEQPWWQYHECYGGEDAWWELGWDCILLWDRVEADHA